MISTIFLYLLFETTMSTAKPQLILGGEGWTFWTTGTFNLIFDQAFPDYDVKIDLQSKHPDLVVRSHYPQQQEHTDAPYFTWSGESYPVIYRKSGQLPLCEFNTFILPRPVKNIYFPLGLGLYGPHDLYLNKEFQANYDRLHTVVYMCSNCVPFREMVFKKFKEALGDEARSLGRCQNPNWKPSNHELMDNHKIYKDYRFVLAMENTDVNAYITEKIMLAYRASAIPIYWGTPFIKTIFNPKSFIYIPDYKTIEDVIARVKEINDNPQLYMEMATACPFIDGKRPSAFDFNPGAPALVEAGTYLRQQYDQYIKNRK